MGATFLCSLRHKTYQFLHSPPIKGRRKCIEGSAYVAMSRFGAVDGSWKTGSFTYLRNIEALGLAGLLSLSEAGQGYHTPGTPSLQATPRILPSNHLALAIGDRSLLSSLSCP